MLVTFLAFFSIVQFESVDGCLRRSTELKKLSCDFGGGGGGGELQDRLFLM